MAAAIKNEFGILATLKEGHNGIFEVSLNEDLIYTNRGACDKLPEGDIQLDVKESLCESCGDVCGEDVDCRIWTYQGQEYTAPPKPMIIEAILRAVYGSTAQSTVEKPVSLTEIPDNLKKFFAAKRKKEQGELSRGGCCEASQPNGGCCH